VKTYSHQLPFQLNYLKILFAKNFTHQFFVLSLVQIEKKIGKKKLIIYLPINNWDVLTGDFGTSMNVNLKEKQPAG
jgi:hypothetical protein